MDEPGSANESSTLGTNSDSLLCNYLTRSTADVATSGLKTGELRVRYARRPKNRARCSVTHDAVSVSERLKRSKERFRSHAPIVAVPRHNKNASVALNQVRVVDDDVKLERVEPMTKKRRLLGGQLSGSEHESTDSCGQANVTLQTPPTKLSNNSNSVSNGMIRNVNPSTCPENYSVKIEFNESWIMNAVQILPDDDLACAIHTPANLERGPLDINGDRTENGVNVKYEFHGKDSPVVKDEVPGTFTPLRHSPTDNQCVNLDTIAGRIENDTVNVKCECRRTDTLKARGPGTAGASPYEDEHLLNLENREPTNYNVLMLNDDKIRPTRGDSLMTVSGLQTGLESTDSDSSDCQIVSDDTPSQRPAGPKEVNRGRAITCSFCNDEFVSLDSFQTHIAKHLETAAEMEPAVSASDDETYSCSACLVNFQTIELLRRHLGKFNSNKPHKCCMCTRGFVLQCNLDYHMLQHERQTSLKCTRCSETFSQFQSLTQHVQTMHAHGNKERMCTICGMKFSHKRKLELHMTKHSHGKAWASFLCTVCGKCYTTQNRLQKHSVRHTNLGTSQ